MKRLALPLLAATPFLSALVPQADGAAIMSHTPSYNVRQFRPGVVKRRFNYGVAAPVAPANPAAAAATPVLDPMLGGTLQIASRSAADAGVANPDDGIIRSRDGTLLVPGTSSAAGLIVVNSVAVTATAGMSGGTLTLSGNNTYNAGDITFAGGSINTLGVGSIGVGGTATLIDASGLQSIAVNGSGNIVGSDSYGIPVIAVGNGVYLYGNTSAATTASGRLTINTGSTVAGDGSLLSAGVLNAANTTGLLYLDPTLTTLPVTADGVGTLTGIVKTGSGTLLGLRRLVLQADGTYALLQPDGTYAPMTVVNGAGTLTLNASTYFSVDQTLGVLNLGNGGVVEISSQPPIAPAAEPVPEPGSALLLALGTLAVSMVRRRTV